MSLRASCVRIEDSVRTFDGLSQGDWDVASAACREAAAVLEAAACLLEAAQVEFEENNDTGVHPLAQLVRRANEKPDNREG